MASYEYCDQCGELTGKAGRGEDSIYCELTRDWHRPSGAISGTGSSAFASLATIRGAATRASCWPSRHSNSACRKWAGFDSIEGKTAPKTTSVLRNRKT